MSNTLFTKVDFSLAPQRHRPDGPLDRVVVELDAAVLEEAAQCRPGVRARNES
jgi:hypothetical protein